MKPGFHKCYNAGTGLCPGRAGRTEPLLEREVNIYRKGQNNQNAYVSCVLKYSFEYAWYGEDASVGTPASKKGYIYVYTGE